MMRERTEPSGPHFPSKKWTATECWWLLAIVLIAAVVLSSGLSVRTLWGPEGRWALIVRDMVRSGSYYLPTANGVVDFDKPLLGYWAVLPFAWLRGLHESTLRLPSVIAGIGIVSLVFCLGRRLFGLPQALLSAGLLLSSGLFVFWSRTASPELLNMLAIWLMFWAYLAGAGKGRFSYLLIFYGIAAFGAFVKGPVAPAVAITTVFFFSLWQAIKEMRGRTGDRRSVFLSWFRWIFSPPGAGSAAIGVTTFLALLFMPVLATGSWASVSLMWKENMVRFFAPFDHVDPRYVYVLSIAQFFAPWTFFLMGVLWEKRRGTGATGERWLLLTALAIFIFFTLSGSRRGYYILPILPALALITGNGIVECVRGRRPLTRVIAIAGYVTTSLLIFVGAGLFLLYGHSADYRHPSELLLGALVIAAGAGALRYFLKGKGGRAIGMLVVLVLLIEMWGFTQGMAMAEKKRTLAGFAENVRRELRGSVGENVCLYQQGTASLIFYLNPSSPLPECSTPAQCDTFFKTIAEPYVIADMNEVKDEEMVRYLGRLQTRIEQAGQAGRGERFVLFRPPKGGPEALHRPTR